MVAGNYYVRLLGALADTLVDVIPAAHDALAVIFLNDAEGGVAKLDHRLVAFLAEPVVTLLATGYDIMSGPQNSSNVGRLMACTVAQ